MGSASKAICSDCVRQRVVHRTCCDRRVLVLVRYNSESVFSQNFSCRGCVGIVQDVGFHTQGRMVYDTLRNSDKSQIVDVVCRCLPILYCLQGKSP